MNDEAVKAAFAAAIRKIGMEAFKQLPMFGSSDYHKEATRHD